jgi:hypothetical protein
VNVVIYTTEDANGGGDDFQSYDYEEAKSYARKYERRVIANTFEFSDSEMVDDFTGETT